jgi:hypothetical protein
VHERAMAETYLSGSHFHEREDGFGDAVRTIEEPRMMNSSPRESDSGVNGRLRGGRINLLVRIGISIGFAVAALTMSAAQAFAYGTPLPCTGRDEAPVFAAWGDRGSYFQVANGGFESGSASWALSGGARVVRGNEAYRVAGASDSHSLLLGPGSAAESQTLCVSEGEETLRLFVGNFHVSGSILHVDVMARNPSTGERGWAAFDVNGDVPSAFWSPTMKLGVPRMFGGNGVEELTITFSTRGASAWWYVDDVYIDPFKSW